MPPNRSEYSKTYRENNREHLAAWSRNYQRNNALRIKLRRKGLTLEDYKRVTAARGTDVCNICQGSPGGRWGSLNIDHDHATGLMRGMLCKSCNQGIGLFADDPERLRKAIDYLLTVEHVNRKFLVGEAGPDTTVDRCERCGCWNNDHVRKCPNKTTETA